MMGDPGSSDLSNIIPTVICILLPITILVIIIFVGIQLFLE
jgi:hypothetical protein